MLINSLEIEQLMDNMSKGLIYVDKEFYVKMFNQRAKEIIGVVFDQLGIHDEGIINTGDIVLIADNCIGSDDGDLCSDDIKIINIQDDSIRPGDTILAVGVYNNSKMEPVYKTIREHLQSNFSLDTNYLGYQINMCIDKSKKTITITVNGLEFVHSFFNSIGHMVVIDGTTGQIKFFQAKGYSIRKEAIGFLLRGSKFLEKYNKTSNFDSVSVIDSNFMDIIEECELTIKMTELFEGKIDSIEESGLYYFNKRLLYCSIYPSSNDGKIKGIYLIIQDASDLEEYLTYRNKILEEVEKKHKYNRVSQKDYPKDAFNSFAGNSAIANEIKYLAYKSSQTRFNVILTGESGTGKSLLAKEIHNNTPNNKASFVEVNCNAIAPTLFESELFGYVGGAFTGAISSGKAGYFEEADGGTIFLDEIGDIPLNIQVKLLYVLQNKTIYRVGSSKPIKIDIRVIVATNKDLAEEVKKGRFRQDLFYRINVFPIEIPPLRKRKEDLYILINQILKKLCGKYGLESKQLSGEALRKMLSYNWPGNVRELENIIERAITLCPTNLIYTEHIMIDSNDKKMTLKELLNEEEKRILQATLLKANGDKQKAMEELSISKSVFYDKLNKHQLN